MQKGSLMKLNNEGEFPCKLRLFVHQILVGIRTNSPKNCTNGIWRGRVHIVPTSYSHFLKSGPTY